MLPEHPIKILLVGSGGREHALCWKLAKSPHVAKIFCAPGNGGTRLEPKCENIDIQAGDFTNLKQFALAQKIDLSVIGPDNALADGIVDELEAAGLRVFGPTREQAKLEWSKSHAKDFMARLNIPTPQYIVCNSLAQAKAKALENNWAKVVKLDGLALGKGVFVLDSTEQVQGALDQIYTSNIFGAKKSTQEQVILLEEKIVGEELSLLMLSDGKHLRCLPPCQDHKRRFDGDTGPNTGGMGAYSPVDLYDRCHKQIDDQIVKPLQEALRSGALSFKGVLYAGIIVSPDPNDTAILSPQVLEFNARFGDPETQAILPRLRSDLAAALWDCTTGELDKTELLWTDDSSCCVVAVAGHYPASSSRGVPIDIANLQAHTLAFHAGTKYLDGKTVTDGGRILAVVATAANLSGAAERCYTALNSVSFDGMSFRSDIGRRAYTKCLSS